MNRYLNRIETVEAELIKCIDVSKIGVHRAIDYLQKVERALPFIGKLEFVSPEGAVPFFDVQLKDGMISTTDDVFRHALNISEITDSAVRFSTGTRTIFIGMQR